MIENGKKPKHSMYVRNAGMFPPRYLGRCPNCGAWNSLIEEVKEQPSAIKQKPHMTFAGNEVKPQLIDEVSTSETPRVKTQYEEFNRVLGGGVVPGSLVLIGGDPGIGKSNVAVASFRPIGSNPKGTVCFR